MRLRNILSAGIMGVTLALVGCTNGATDNGNGDGTLTNRVNGLFEDTGYTNYGGYGTNGYSSGYGANNYNTNGTANGYSNGYGTNGYGVSGYSGYGEGMNGANTITGNGTGLFGTGSGYGYNNYYSNGTTRSSSGNYGYNPKGLTNYGTNSAQTSIDNDLKTVTSPLRGTTTNNNTTTETTTSK